LHYFSSKASACHQGHKTLCQLYIVQAALAPRGGLGIAAPEFFLEHLIYHGQAMRFFGIKPAKAERQAKHQATQRGHGNAKGGKPRRIMPRDCGLQGGKAFRGLRHWHQALGYAQRRIQRQRGPIK
jgi:hypothetical protein